jgi:hypothetical protein
LLYGNLAAASQHRSSLPLSSKNRRGIAGARSIQAARRNPGSSHADLSPAEG